LAIVLFQPGLSSTTEWTVRYRADGLWEPLRGTGTDRFHWDTATTSGSHHATLTGLAVTVVFPPGWTDVGLAETGGAGSASDAVRRPSGHQVLRWQDETATAIQYDWQLDGHPQ